MNCLATFQVQSSLKTHDCLTLKTKQTSANGEGRGAKRNVKELVLPEIGQNWHDVKTKDRCNVSHNVSCTVHLY